MPIHRYGLEQNADGTWSVMDFFEGRVAEMDGEFLNRIPLELATSLMALLNIAEQKRSQLHTDGRLN